MVLLITIDYNDDEDFDGGHDDDTDDSDRLYRGMSSPQSPQVLDRFHSSTGVSSSSKSWREGILRSN